MTRPPLPDNDIMLGQCSYVKVYNVSAFEIEDFEQLQKLASKFRHINRHYDPASVSEPIVAIESGKAPLFLDPPAHEDDALSETERQSLAEIQCGIYAEGLNEERKPYYAYFHIKASLLEPFLQQQAQNIISLKDFFCYPEAHGEGLPDEDTRLAMAKNCFIQGVLQIFGFREPPVQW